MLTIFILVFVLFITLRTKNYPNNIRSNFLHLATNLNRIRSRKINSINRTSSTKEDIFLQFFEFFKLHGSDDDMVVVRIVDGWGRRSIVVFIDRRYRSVLYYSDNAATCCYPSSRPCFDRRKTSFRKLLIDSRPPNYKSSNCC